MKKFFLYLFITLLFLNVKAGEGMWIPSLIKQLAIDDMQANGLKLSAEQIYSINQSSLKDAIVHFGGGCTSEIISSDGLLLTNHHCGYGSIQSHSSLEKDYLTDGFWAANQSEELPNSGLTATIIKRIENVTEKVLKGTTNEMSEKERNELVSQNSKLVVDEAMKGNHFEAFVKPFYDGNEYYMMVVEKFLDVRLVGAPPSSIGKYGFDTDNWIWPRHTGDFSLFRIYAGKDNLPAPYSEENVPYQPNHFLPINLSQVEENQFTMVYGFPGTTQEYLTSYAVDMLQNLSYPIRIDIRTQKLMMMDERMAGNDEVRIKYAAKQSSTSNAWKKWKGEIRGLKKFNAIDKKVDYEMAFKRAISKNKKQAKYNSLLDNLEKSYEQLSPLQLAKDYFVETSYYGAEIMRFVYGYKALFDGIDEEGGLDTTRLNKLISGIPAFFKNYDLPTDQEIFIAMLKMYAASPDNEFKPTFFKEFEGGKYQGDYEAYAEMLYANSPYVNQEKLSEALLNWSDERRKQLSEDALYVLTLALYDNYFTRIKPAYDDLYAKISELNRKYMQAQMDVLPDAKKYYPDANGTLRIAYGKVEPYEPRDGVMYNYYTTLEGVIEKYDPEVKEFDLPKRLIELYQDRDYGRYGKNGQLRVCFIASNHTTGGNSGSPVLNENGELIGLNFDRNWEGTMSDLMYDPGQCRNISVDINYVLFIIDKFANAGYLLENMDIREGN